MKTVADLGRAIKAKYPGSYDDMSDVELGRKIKAQYPEYSDYQDVSLATQTSNVPAYLVEPFPNNLGLTGEQIEQLRTHYSPNRGRFTSWWQRGKGEGRNKLLSVLNEEQLKLIQNASLLEREAMKSRENLAKYHVFLTQNAALIHQLKANEHLINQALNKGRDVQTDQRIILEDALTRLRLEEEEIKSDIRVREHERLKEVDLNAAQRSAEDALNAADRMKLNPYKLIEQLSASLSTMYDEQAMLEQKNDAASKNKLQRLNKNIRFLEETIDARQSRLLQDEYGNKPGRTKEANSNTRAAYPPESDTD